MRGILVFALIIFFVPGCGKAVEAITGKKVIKAEVTAGNVTITDDEDGLSHVHIECNNGLEIDADWKRNPYNDFGYDIYEPVVNRDTSRMAIMLTSRAVIAAYLRGEYD